MQSIGYIKVNGETIKVLYRDMKTSRYLRLRESGEDGRYLEDEEIHFICGKFRVNCV